MFIVCFGAIGAVLALAFVLLIINFDSRWKTVIELLTIAGNGGVLFGFYKLFEIDDQIIIIR